MNEKEQEIVKQFIENERYRKPGDGLKAVKALSDLMWDKIALKIRIS